ncbi:hypothetical protein GCM10023194_32850 [Planotetraspora phitsanulokensis]|uniref:Uncharacterized protein n=1 Tax=Planotetraspora phitsanulokensis TaxID=575192 RepID=A0A8J3TZR5_9ACTN|nr:hypothetical protein Pph01_05790 [Planotetraspora phitsanulokensis]
MLRHARDRGHRHEDGGPDDLDSQDEGRLADDTADKSPTQDPTSKNEIIDRYLTNSYITSADRGSRMLEGRTVLWSDEF